MRVEPSVFTAPDSAWAEEEFSHCLSLHTQNMRLGSFSHKLCFALNLIDPDTNYLDLSIYPTSANYRQHADWAYHAAWIPAKYTLEGIADPKRLHYRNTFLAYHNTFFQQRDEGYLKNISSQEKAARKLEIKNNLDNFKTFLRDYKEGPSRYNTSINSLKGADYLAVLEGATYQGKPYLTIEGRYKQELRDLFSELYDHRPHMSKKDLDFFRSLASGAMGQEGYRYVWSTDPQKNIGSNPAGYQHYFEQEKYHLLWFKPDLIADERRHNRNLILFAHEFGHSIGTLDGGWVDKSSADYGDVPSINQLFEVVVGQQMNFDMSGYALYRNGELEPNHDLYISPYRFLENVISLDKGHVALEQKHVTPEKKAELEALFGRQGTKDFDIKEFIKATKFNKPRGRPAYLLKNKL